MPTSDSQYFRGLIEYFLQTKDLNPLVSYHNYYQWPAYFILFQIITSSSALSVINFEFLLFFIIGLLLTTGLYVYASRVFKNSAFVAVIAFFISNMLLFLNYQAVPFSLALGLLLLIFMLESGTPTKITAITEGLLYTGTLFLHAFVPLFFVIYCLGRGILSKSKNYLMLFVLATVSYFMVQLSIARFSFLVNIRQMMNLSPEFSNVVAGTVGTPVIIPIDALAQVFSRLVTLGFIGLSALGFLLLLKNRKLSTVDKTVFLVGLVYSGVGLVLYTLGTRAVVLIFIPLTLGAAYLFEYKFKRLRRLFKYSIPAITVVLLSLFLFVQVHQAFIPEIQFQTSDTYDSSNFFLDHYNFQRSGLSLVMDYRTMTYFQSRIVQEEFFQYENVTSLQNTDAIFYTYGLGRTVDYNFTGQNLTQQDFNRLYDDGSSFIAINANR
ncbi:MAG: hypothetical protein ACQCN5_07470 [Candidatus Bathyarchaeia archaeon]